MKHNRNKRVFVGTQPSTPARRERVKDHVQGLAEQALVIATDLYRQENAKPTAANMLVFIVAVMVSLEIGEPIEEVLQFSKERGEQFSAMSGLLWLLFELNALTLPDGFPYTLEQLRAVA